MVLPEEEEYLGRVRVVRTESGRLVGFQDPDRGNRFITRAEALDRLTYSVERDQVQDTFGNRVGIGGLAIPNRGIKVTYAVKSATYQPIPEDPLQYKPASNQEIIERFVIIKPDGSLTHFEISHGSGKAYDPAKGGARWRTQVSEALGLPTEARLPTKDLKRAQYYSEVVVKTVSG